MHTRLFPVQLLTVGKKHSGVVESLCLGLLDLGVLEQCLREKLWFLHPFVFVVLMVMEEAPQNSAGMEEKSIYFHRHCKVTGEEFGELNMLVLLPL